MNVRVIHDCRLRSVAHPLLVGDTVERDGRTLRVIALRREGNRYFLTLAPDEALSPEWFAKMYGGEFQTDAEFPSNMLARAV